MTLLGARRRPPPEEYWNAARGRCQPRPAGLRLGGDWRKKLAESENDREPDQPHGHLGGGWLAGSLAECHDGHLHRPQSRPLSSRPLGQHVQTISDQFPVGHIRASDHYWSFLRRPGARRVVLENLREGVSVMFGLGSQELLVILVIVLVLFCANRLPQLARSRGSSLSAL